MSNRKKYKTAFGEALAEQLERRQVTQSELAKAANVSNTYANHTMAGRKSASPQWADLVADVLKLSDKERAELHRAAARDKGYKI